MTSKSFDSSGMRRLVSRLHSRIHPTPTVSPTPVFGVSLRTFSSCRIILYPTPLFSTPLLSHLLPFPPLFFPISRVVHLTPVYNAPDLLSPLIHDQLPSPGFCTSFLSKTPLNYDAHFFPKPPFPNLRPIVANLSFKVRRYPVSCH